MLIATHLPIPTNHKWNFRVINQPADPFEKRPVIITDPCLLFPDLGKDQYAMFIEDFYRLPKNVREDESSLFAFDWFDSKKSTGLMFNTAYGDANYLLCYEKLRLPGFEVSVDTGLIAIIPAWVLAGGIHENMGLQGVIRLDLEHYCVTVHNGIAQIGKYLIGFDGSNEEEDNDNDDDDDDY